MNPILFDETAWIKLIFLLADTQQWVDELSDTVFEQVPLQHKKKLFRPTYRFSPQAMAHILERHYFKIARHPGTGKFNISLPALMACIRDAGSIDPLPVPGSLNLQRVLHTTGMVGFDKHGLETACLTVITQPGGTIITAFPGILNQHPAAITPVAPC